MTTRGDSHTVCFLLSGWEEGGVARATLELIRRINPTRFDVRVISTDEGPFARELAEVGVGCDILGTGQPPQLTRNTAAGRATHWRGRFKAPAWIFKTVRALNRHIRAVGADLIHTNYHTFHLIAGLSSRRTRCPCVWHWHGVVEEGFVERACRRVRVRAGDLVWSIANSQATERSVRRLAGERLCVIENGVELSPTNGPGRLKELLAVPKAARIVGMVATLHPIKGHVHFIEAAARVCAKHDDVHFVHIGGHTSAGQHDYLKSLQKRQQELGIGDRFRFMGHRDDAAELAADFEVAVSCTLPPGEGFGLAIVEAMARKVPVIATNIGAPSEFLTDDQTAILVPPADSIALAVAIEDLLASDEKRKLIVEQAYELCRTRFDVQKTVEKIERLYEERLSER